MGSHIYIKLVGLSLFFTILFVGCENTNKNTNPTSDLEYLLPQKEWIGRKININSFSKMDTIFCSERSSLEKNETHNIVYYFNGECSSCIAKLAEWHKDFIKVKKNNEDVKCTYVSFGIDSDILQYYLEQLNVNLNHCLLHDKNKQILKKNDLLNKKKLYTYVLLLDAQGKVMAFGNPFEAKNVMDIYKKNRVFKL
ncbi:hypothetical protein NO995_07675 [Aestuariibaculum sp. M13]|uniref:hypothetical protein n=1 Tax=Aestuariibaculum sp. M13 TaxID=2967132 RepID=UPI002159FA0B|nr:hypothetical protein [Aestuariibaculum sp. M13]MCR8667555.1 hypothetical protein [Aestuariibaculum sp. M13]